MERIEAIVSGRVQMVMYRDFTQRKASALALAGEVRNLPNGTVKVIAEGSKDSLEKLLTHLRRGPLLARVENVSVSWLPATGASAKFRIAYD